VAGAGADPAVPGRLPALLAAGRSIATGALAGLDPRRRVEPLRPPARVAVPGLGAAEPGHEAAIEAMTAEADLGRLQTLMDAGELTSVELTEHLLRRAVRTDAALHALVELGPGALAEARAADARRASGERSPLLGVPLTVKDNIETGGPTHTTAGAEVLLDHVAARDAPVVAALRLAGAVVLGKAALSELAGAVARTPGFSAVGGQTTNPYGPSFTPGGSSSGSAVSVAAGLVPVSVGTETSGSLLAPAAWNGVVGVKPGRGVVDGAGVVPLLRHQDTVGPLARTVADAAAVLAVLSAGRVVADLAADALDGVRVGVLRAAVLGHRSAFESTSDNAQVLGRAEQGLRAAGARLVDTEVPWTTSPSRFESSVLALVLGGLTHDTVGYLREAGAPVGSLADLHAHNLRRPATRMPKGQFFVSLALARRISRDAYESSAPRLRAEAESTLERTFDAPGVDVLVSLGNLHSSLYATAGYPAVSVPLGLRDNGMPAGVTLIGRAGRDAELLGVAHALELATRLRRAPVVPSAG
jgi:amidase